VRGQRFAWPLFAETSYRSGRITTRLILGLAVGWLSVGLNESASAADSTSSAKAVSAPIFVTVALKPSDEAGFDAAVRDLYENYSSADRP
jgi:hypothetical protein